jgi:hypothetical protein
VLVESTCDCGAGRSLHGANVRAISPLFRGPLELGPVLGRPFFYDHGHFARHNFQESATATIK